MSSWTTNDLAALESAIKTGATRVSYQDRDVSYRSLDDMLRIRDLMRADLGQVGDSSQTRYASFSKGL